MKNNVKRALIASSLLFALSLCTGCKYASKYGDDAYKMLKKSVSKPKPPRISPHEENCKQCYGSGFVYDAYGWAYKCEACDGDGKVWVMK